MTYEQIRQDEDIKTYIRQADASLGALGYTEHSFAHVGRVAHIAGYIMETLGYPAREVELGYENTVFMSFFPHLFKRIRRTGIELINLQ